MKTWGRNDEINYQTKGKTKKHEEKQLVVENALESSNLGECIELVVAATLGNYWISYKPFSKERIVYVLESSHQ